MDNENNNIQDWYYAGEADIVIGETPISNTAKIVLIILCVLLVAVIGTTIYFRHYIVDYIANPTVQLSTNEITLNVYDEFNPENYIANKEKISNVEYNINNTVNTSTLGDYTVTYESKNRARTNTANLLVHVVDKIAPSIQLVNNGSVILVDNSDEINNFDPMNYILEVSDNYDKNVKLDYNTPTKETFSNAAQSSKAVAVNYTATDSSGNTAQATLTVFVQLDYESMINNSGASQEEIEELQRQLEEQQKQLEEQQKQIDEQKKELEEKQNPTPTPETKPTIKPSGGNQTDPTNPPSETTQTSSDIVFSAGSFTWSISKDGNYEPKSGGYPPFLQRARNKVTYKTPNGDGTAYPISGPGIDQQFTTGTFTIVWEESLQGKRCNQTVIITE